MKENERKAKRRKGKCSKITERSKEKEKGPIKEKIKGERKERKMKTRKEE